ncbi:glycoside hydrolase family 76 protein [Diplodia corticola]|uniref:Mannan endo-1,6-alpha-mannosidase n=1 Tax=Diplodia corticola TaxID=236234 RepID=A0A1J9R6X8_9PEZI|nr:glycoside hydrolase family 76 protein [Diplodia corticola]OJD36289.1 glycoside hydrolase family 76 protein [Diplodia corticola]
MRAFGPTLATLLSLSSLTTAALTLDVDDPNSIKSAASTIAYGLMRSYTGNQTGQIPGYLPQPYYWWEAGSMFMTMVEYWYSTGDATYNDVTSQALLFQVGENKDFMPTNQTKDEGNDDQVFWAFAALSAAELGFPNPPADQPQWLALAQAVFNTQAARWDRTSCGGGLRWQIFTFNDGYDYKNAISNGGFFQLSARLARYTGNATYADWAERMWDWLAQSPLLDTKTSPTKYTVNDGTSTTTNCSSADRLQWTYNYGTLVSGAAYMYNHTNGTAAWETRLSALLNGTYDTFFPQQYSAGTIMSEITCEQGQTCDNDQPSFKAYLARWMAVAAQLAPFTAAAIAPRLRASALGAAKQCAGGEGGIMCGRRWYQDTWDGFQGIGEQMSALSVVQANMLFINNGTDGADTPKPPLSADTGGSSKGDPSAGTGSGVAQPRVDMVTTADKAGAAILTVGVVILTVGGALFMVLGV